MSLSLRGRSLEYPPLNPEAVVIERLVDPEMTEVTSVHSKTPKSCARSFKAYENLGGKYLYSSMVNSLL